MGYLSQEPSVFRKLTVEKNLLAILEALPPSPQSLGRKLSYAGAVGADRRGPDRAVPARPRPQEQRRPAAPAARSAGSKSPAAWSASRCSSCSTSRSPAVDPKTTEDIRQNIRDLAHQGIGILLTDHNVREVLKITDRSYLIKDGQVVTHGTPQQLIHDPIAINEYLGTDVHRQHVRRGPGQRPDRPTALTSTCGGSSRPCGPRAPARRPSRSCSSVAGRRSRR